jgi:hypothetical protein
MKSGGISWTSTNNNGDVTVQQIYDYDLFPIRRMSNMQNETEQHKWRVVFAREGERDFSLDADALYDRAKFSRTLANVGIFPKTADIPHVQEYMISYIKELQRRADADKQLSHLGWTKDRSGFILPDRMLLDDGTQKPVSLTLGATRASQQIYKCGTLERQLELLKFYNDPSYLGHQFFILNGLAAPLFHATGHHGVVVNATGKTASSKSTALYTAASFWGDPKLYPINGTRRGATTNFRNERITTLANLPVMVDEITKMDHDEAHDMAMGVTQPGNRGRLENTGVERAAPDGHKATILMTTANSSLHGLLSRDNTAGTAGSMRAVELHLSNPGTHSKAEADDYLMDLCENFGHIGEIYMSEVMRHPEYAPRVREIVRRIDTAANITGGERFWSGDAAAVFAAGEIAVRNGLLSYDVDKLTRWFIEEQIPAMRGVVKNEYTTPIGMLADYLEKINGDILVTEKTRGGMNMGMINPLRLPRGQLLAHFDLSDKTLTVLKNGFRNYCASIGANPLQVLDELVATPRIDGRRLIINHTAKKTLGAGTDLAKAQSICFIIDMQHPEITGVSEAIAKPSLHVVK